MYSILSLFIAAFMAVFVVALPHPGGSGSINSSCNGGTVQCCDSSAPAKSSAVQDKLKSLSVVDALVPVSGTVGLTCTPVSVLAIAGKSCSSQSVCCTGNNFSNGAVVAGCDPITANGI